MRNSGYKDDQKVFTFINSEYCKDYEDLVFFLKENYLPIRPSWVFYCLGKLNLIDDQVIAEMESKDDICYGGYIKCEIFYWERFLRNESQEKELIVNELKEESKELTREEINRIFIERGWDFVEEYMDWDKEEIIYRYMAEYQDELYSKSCNESDEPPYCDACQSSPCMCSDREQTSTVYDY